MPLRRVHSTYPPPSSRQRRRGRNHPPLQGQWSRCIIPKDSSRPGRFAAADAPLLYCIHRFASTAAAAVRCWLLATPCLEPPIRRAWTGVGSSAGDQGPRCWAFTSPRVVLSARAPRSRAFQGSKTPSYATPRRVGTSAHAPLRYYYYRSRALIQNRRYPFSPARPFRAYSYLHARASARSALNCSFLSFNASRLFRLSLSLFIQILSSLQSARCTIFLDSRTDKTDTSVTIRYRTRSSILPSAGLHPNRF